MQYTLRRRMLIAVMAASACLAAGAISAPAHAQTTQPASAAQLDALLSKQAITELIYKYPRALDRLDRDLLLSLAHPDARMQFGKRAFPSWSAYVDWLIKAHTDMLGSNHRISNILIEVDGDRAVSESTGTATLLVRQEGREDQYEERWMHSRYLDTWSRRAGKWALDSRHTVTDYRRISYVPAEDVKKRYEVLPKAGKADPSYALFGHQ
ncbi:nuclear transport factor 2 family protein [Cupriavidus sp. H39]|uniref:nuclear transport factor 2 family protein n=1 Tax=Cupriavidus sp. H39 TaxID=3401635 RepID=UPI003D085258